MRIMLYMGNGNVVESSGGAERVLCDFANALVQRGHQAIVVCNDLKSGLPFYPLDSRVEFVNIDGRGIKKQYPKHKKLQREFLRSLQKFSLFDKVADPVELMKIRDIALVIQPLIERWKPDVAIPFFLEDMLSMVHGRNTAACPIIMMLHNTPNGEFLKKIQPRVIQKELAKCERIQVLMPSFMSVVEKFMPGKTVVIPNTVPQLSVDQIADHLEKKSRFSISMIGRLDKIQKKQHFLIGAFARIARFYPEWEVVIYGKEYHKNYQNQLHRLVKKYNLGRQVFLHEATSTPFEVLKKSDIFAFPTAFEGFPLALTEAMSVGLPCVGLKTTPAVNELIIDGQNGLLAENNEGDFAQKLKILMDDRDLRIHMGKNGHEFVKQFAPEIIWDQWEKLLREIVQNHNRDSYAA